MVCGVRYGLVARIPGSHPGGPGSIPGTGIFLCILVLYVQYLLASSFLNK